MHSLYLHIDNRMAVVANKVIRYRQCLMILQNARALPRCGFNGGQTATASLQPPRNSAGDL